MLDSSKNPLMQFQIWDCPGDIDFDDRSVDTDAIFKNAGALVFVIDAQVRPVIEEPSGTDCNRMSF